jgi:hypothetical protein
VIVSDLGLLKASHEVHRVQRREGQSYGATDGCKRTIRPETIGNQRWLISFDLKVHPTDEEGRNHETKT